MTLMKPVIATEYPVAIRAFGSRIWDADGNEWLDGASGAIACSIGYSHPHVIDAIAAQLRRLSFIYRTQFSNEPAERLADRLCTKLGYGAAFFVNSGSEAVESATRLAQQYWKERGQPTKTAILSRTLSYHGATGATLALSGHWPRRRAAGPILGEPTIPTPYCFRCPSTCGALVCAEAYARRAETEIRRRGAENVAALLLEPIVGASGAAIVPPPGYLQRIREICDRNEVLLIADEVLTGLGRTGRWLAADHGEIKADIVCLGKGLNAGYVPFSAVLATSAVLDAIESGSRSFSLGHTHSNHPVGAAAANAVLDVLEEEALVERAATMGPRIAARLKALTANLPIVCDIRGAGAFFGIELSRHDQDHTPFPASLQVADHVVAEAAKQHLVLYPARGFVDGENGDAVIFAPPLNTDERDLERMLDRLATALRRTTNHLDDTLEKTDENAFV